MNLDDHIRAQLEECGFVLAPWNSDEGVVESWHLPGVKIDPGGDDPYMTISTAFYLYEKAFNNHTHEQSVRRVENFLQGFKEQRDRIISYYLAEQALIRIFQKGTEFCE